MNFSKKNIRPINIIVKQENMEGYNNLESNLTERKNPERKFSDRNFTESKMTEFKNLHRNITESKSPECKYAEP